MEMIVYKPHGHYKECPKCNARGLLMVNYVPVHDLLQKNCMNCGYDNMYETPADIKEDRR